MERQDIGPQGGRRFHDFDHDDGFHRGFHGRSAQFEQGGGHSGGHGGHNQAPAQKKEMGSVTGNAYHHGQPILSSCVESAVNQVVSKRFVKRQRMATRPLRA
ncbi:hypothetical protein OKW33_007849 [Paraburkholderia atlantica]|uniref:hypothetical protein n=1 Tax=Paraburkholderia atlantica TaxID=2654982 RepID=UPI000A0019EE|nr:hypothetical protein [Paraburkholderia atlantica]MPW08204.1 hypothetical protein [Paraburkholderia atlantica]